MKKILGAIAISIPVILSVFLVRMQSLAHQELSPPECRVKKWNIAASSFNTQNQDASIQKLKTSQLPALIQRLPVTCCQDDASCIDEFIYGQENNQPPDKKALLTAIDHSLTYLQTANAVAAYSGYQSSAVH
ncbi:hypothetical protein [aff. Roholtiella sp. LEGE 12411]|uniref:hypothetical protein n=1 Tax=aff. Roholtiella sp. LEGE 12411 TaxID=1828822 RepID=UPI00187DF08F|nr:hypothetical protein [aff. Roholtiella sp. LEGE 12411]MBE9038313.1 hypothetical protein [aff. Roholtiella sp. LEGE 12411]